MLEEKAEDAEVAGGESEAEETQARLETAAAMDDGDTSSPCLWLGATVIGGGRGGGALWTVGPPPYKFDKLFIVMAELWFQYAVGGAPNKDCW